MAANFNIIIHSVNVALDECLDANNILNLYLTALNGKSSIVTRITRICVIHATGMSNRILTA
jgi:hypothetical protein